MSAYGLTAVKRRGCPEWLWTFMVLLFGNFVCHQPLRWLLTTPVGKEAR